MKGFLALFALLVAVGAARAEGNLSGHLVTFYVLTYNDPAAPLFRGVGKTVRIDDGVEFGLEQEGAQNDLDVLPVMVNLGPQRIELSYEGSPPNYLVQSKFNGYVLEFVTTCALVTGARVDRAATNMPLAEDALTLVDGGLRINVQDMPVNSASRIAIDVDVEDCPLS